MERLGPGFDSINFREGNIKRLHNLTMYGGFALCEETRYERNDLDQINIQEKDLLYENKPVHIDKLFANEEKYMELPLRKK